VVAALDAKDRLTREVVAGLEQRVEALEKKLGESGKAATA
jgi:BMFP domain-containing protein YqiC